VHLMKKKENQIRTYRMEISVIYELTTKGYSKLQKFSKYIIHFSKCMQKGKKLDEKQIKYENRRDLE
jgi:hypothetical protein